jgi:hypothetical protein
MNVRAIFRCDHCRGPVWIEDLPDSEKVLDFVCIICGKRWFINSTMYKKLAKLLVKKKYDSLPASRRKSLSI